MNQENAELTLLKAERDVFIYFVKGVMLYRIVEEIKQNVLKNWNSENFEVELRAATKNCNEMREGIDEKINHLIALVPEISAYNAELKEKFNKQKEEQNDRNNSTKKAN